MHARMLGYLVCHNILYQYRSQAKSLSRGTGCKGFYSLMKLPSHNPVRQTTPDSMHTIKDAIEHIFKLIIGKEDSVKVRKAEIQLGRFGITSPVIKKKNGSKDSDDCGVPFRLSDQEIKIADERALSILIPRHIDYLPGAIFSFYIGSHMITSR